MEYIPGKDLQQIVSEENVLDYKLAARYGAQSANGLHHAHETGLIHPDIKPENLLVDDKGPSKILDMGLVRKSYGNITHTISFSENVLGTADYGLWS